MAMHIETNKLWINMLTYTRNMYMTTSVLQVFEQTDSERVLSE